MTDLQKIKAKLEKTKCPFHGQTPKIKILENTIEIDHCCCMDFQEILATKVKELIAKEQKDGL